VLFFFDKHTILLIKVMQFISIEKMGNSRPSWFSSIRFYSSRFTKIKKGRKQEIRRIHWR